MKKQHNLIPGLKRAAILMIAIIFLMPICAPGANAANWYQGSSGRWLFRKMITIDHTKVLNSNQTNFPVLISLTDSSLKTIANGGKVQSINGYDIIFTDSNGVTKLDHEIESYNPATGAIIMWVREPTLSYTVDTSLYMYYGNSAISASQENKTGVWNTNYTAVWHLKESGNGTSGEFKDSTSNANNGQGGAGTSTKVPTQVAAEIGNGQNFNGSQLINAASVTGISAINANQTASWWYKVTSNPTDTRNFFSIIGSSTANQAAFRSSALAMTQWGGTVTISTTPGTANNWHHVVWTRNGSTNSIYVDGALKTTSTTALQTGAASQVIFGSYDTNPNEAYNGILDEVELSNIALSSNWISTQYNNQSSPSTFYSVGIEEWDYSLFFMFFF